MIKFLNECINRELVFSNKEHRALGHTFSVPYVPEQTVHLTIDREKLHVEEDFVPLEIHGRVIICNDPDIDLVYVAGLDTVQVTPSSLIIEYRILDNRDL